jgi:hypothetical protein
MKLRRRKKEIKKERKLTLSNALSIIRILAGNKIKIIAILCTIINTALAESDDRRLPLITSASTRINVLTFSVI